MSEGEGQFRRPRLSWTILAGILIVLLALGALLWPGHRALPGTRVLLVFDSSGNRARTVAVYEPLQRFLGSVVDEPLELAVVRTTAEFRDRISAGADFVFCPDGLGISLDPKRHVPVAVGRRPAPRNLRPRGVLVYRKTAGLVDSPWLSRGQATVCGDSVSLTATGMWRRQGMRDGVPSPSYISCSWGPDPYDHAPVLHALRLGGFDYALVRQWDADRFFADGLLSPLEWGLEIMTVPVPDIVLFAGTSVPANIRLAVGDRLSALGRDTSEMFPAAEDLKRGIANLNLAGFNLLLEPDFELVRRNFSQDWPQATD